MSQTLNSVNTNYPLYELFGQEIILGTAVTSVSLLGSRQRDWTCVPKAFSASDNRLIISHPTTRNIITYRTNISIGLAPLSMGRPCKRTF